MEKFSTIEVEAIDYNDNNEIKTQNRLPRKSYAKWIKENIELRSIINRLMADKKNMTKELEQITEALRKKLNKQ
tara:strand:- start:88 stop:309 length:222 start_codon:yes stop_codon:yes gene_type:complete